MVTIFAIPNGVVVQLVRMPACHAGGRGFESRPFRKKLHSNVRLFCFMPFYVYIIQSQADLSYYKGFSENPSRRLLQHNNGECKYTSTKMPWALVYIELLLTKRDALIRERGLKKYASAQIQKLLLTDKNILKSFNGSAG